MSLPVLDFISRLIRHIPDQKLQEYPLLRFLITQASGELLPVVYKRLDMESVTAAKVLYHLAYHGTDHL